MGAHVAERDRPFRGRIACRQGACFACAGLLLLLFAPGCRSAGSRANDPLSAKMTEDVPSKRNTLAPKEPDEQTLTESERVALVVKRNDLRDERQPAEYSRRGSEAARSSDVTSDDEMPSIESGGRARVVQSTRRKKSDRPGLDQSLIQIMNFEQPDDFDPPKRRKNPRRLPNTPDDETSASLRLKFPEELPGSNAANLEFPPSDDDHPELTQRKMDAINRMFPPATTPRRLDMPTDRAMTLEELEELAMQNSPRIIQALAAITMAQGSAIQAGVSPNPTLGYESDTVGSSFTRDYQGISISQPFKTAGKLGLQRAVANMDLMNSQLVYERTKLDVLHDVRSFYYSVQVAQEAMKINEALVRFSNQVYEIMVNRLKNDEQAGYELSQLQSLVDQARATLVASQNRYVSAWKQLAASIGIPELRPAPLEGRVDITPPNLDYDALLEWVVNVHPDLHASRNLKTQAQLNLDLQKRVPIPDVNVLGVFQNDFTTPGFNRTSYNLNISVPVPIFDRNQGNIRSAEGRYSLSTQQYSATKNILAAQLADSYERYQTGKVQSEYYRTRIIPNLARAYRGVYYRHIDDSDKVAFGDIIVAQQNLAAGISTYITFLLQQWMAAVDIANLVQLRNFRELYPASNVDPIPASDTDVPPIPRAGGQP